MRIRSIILRLSCILAFCCSAHAKTADAHLILTTEDYPPFNIVDPNNGNLSGISTEKVKEIMHRSGETYTISAYPWARAFQMARTDANTCVFSTTRMPEREAMFKWVGPLVKNNWFVFARADDTRKPKSLEDLRPYIMGIYRNDAVGEFLTSKGFKTDIANADADNPRKLLIQRFDFWATGELLGLAILKNQGLQGKIVPRFQFNQTEMYLACHPAIAPERIELFNQILKDIEHDGTAAAIEKKYK
ncbi:ABC transporter substrate-binding protein [Undibacterium piscinae]|uniref:ABC transporter substrate-binding protein n=1 Tax=Undibacterium piscinae TaxID=2495591 RepID=A0A6M4A645_9BURK|nr:ABC transporter substrate-binding protein [Undibacterium piscinae]